LKSSLNGLKSSSDDLKSSLNGPQSRRGNKKGRGRRFLNIVLGPARKQASYFRAGP
jgi:hypothetical protein